MKTRDVAIKLSLKDADLVKRGLETLGKDGQLALTRLEKASKPASKGLLAVNAAASAGKGEIRSWANSAGVGASVLEAFGPAGIAAAAGIGVFLLALRQARAAAQNIAEIGELADQAGVAVEAFQELTLAADRYGISLDALTDGQKELALRADEFVATSAGSAAEAFERIGFTQDTLRSKLGDTSALFDEVIDRISVLDTRAAQIRVADEIFGGQGGEQFVRLLDAGVGSMAKLRAEARELGLVIDKETVARARDLNGELKTMERVIDVQLDQAFLDLAPILVSAAGLFADIARAVGDVVDGFKSIENQKTENIRSEIAELKATLTSLENIDPAKASNAAQSFLAFLGSGGKSLEQNIADTKEQITLLEAQLNLREDLAKPPPPPSGGELTDKIKETIEALEFERLQLNRTSTEQAVHNTLKRAGIEVTNDHAASIRNLVTAIEAERARQQETNQALSDVQQLIDATVTSEERRAEGIRKITLLLDQQKITAEQAARAQVELDKQVLDSATDAASGIRRGLDAVQADLQDMASTMENAVTGAFEGMEDALVEFVKTGKVDFKSLADSIISELIRIQARQALAGIFGGGQQNSTGGLSGLFSGLFGGQSSGPQNIIPGFASGGSLVVGGKSGVDRNVLKINDEPVANISRGETLGVMPAGGGQGIVLNMPVNVNVTDRSDGADVAVEGVRQGPDGIDIDLVIERKVSDMVRGGGLDGPMRSRFDLGVGGTLR